MFRDKRLVSLMLSVALLCYAALVPVQAASVVKLTLEAGSHQVTVNEQTLLIETSDDLIVKVSSDGSFLRGVLEAADSASGSVHVRIFRLGPPDELLYEGQVLGPTIFEASDADETGHVEL